MFASNHVGENRKENCYMCRVLWKRGVLLALLLTAVFSTSVKAGFPATPGVNYSANVIYPTDGNFIFGGTFVLSTPQSPVIGNGQISGFPGVGSPGNTVVQVGDDDEETATGDFSGDLSLNGGPAVEINGSATMTVTIDDGASLGYDSASAGSMDTVLDSLDIQASGGGNSIQITLNPSDASTGQESSTAEGGGLFNIQSFFDVFADISLNGGPAVPVANPNTMTLYAPDGGATLPLALLSLATLVLARRHIKSAV